MKQKLKCIVLIDDEPADNFFHTNTINKLGCTEQTIAFENAQDALNYLGNPADSNYVKPDIIFLDINMPSMDGWEFLEHYRRLDPEYMKKIICVMLTTSINPSDRRKAKRFNEINLFLSKPLRESDLQEILNTYFS